MNNTYVKKSLSGVDFLFLFGNKKRKRKGKKKDFKGKRKNGSRKTSQARDNISMHTVF